MFAMLGPPGKHQEILKRINTWEYEIEGEVAKGKQSPYISEIRLYDIRIPEAIQREVIRDLDLYGHGWGVTESWRSRAFMFLYGLILRLFTPFNPIPVVKGKKKYEMPGWFYIMPIGLLKRKKVKVHGGADRDVL